MGQHGPVDSPAMGCFYLKKEVAKNKKKRVFAHLSENN